MSEYYTLLTSVGLDKIAKAQVNGTNVLLTQIVVGDANGTPYSPTGNETKLVNEVTRINLDEYEIDPDYPNRILLSAEILQDVGDFYIREIGVVDKDNTLIAIANYPSKYKAKSSSGVGNEVVIEFIVDIGSLTAGVITVDPSYYLATSVEIDQDIDTHNADLTAHPSLEVPIDRISLTGKTPNAFIKTNSSGNGVTYSTQVFNNDAILEEFSVDSSGKLLFNGQSIGSGNEPIVDVVEVNDSVESLDRTYSSKKLQDLFSNTQTRLEVGNTTPTSPKLFDLWVDTSSVYTLKMFYGLTPSYTNIVQDGVNGKSSFEDPLGSTLDFDINHPPSNAFDNTGSYFSTPSGMAYPCGLDYTFNYPVLISEYFISIPNADSLNTPNSWNLEAYNTNTNTWDILDVQSGITDWSSSKTINLNNTTYYTRYKLNITAGNGTDHVSINTLELRSFTGSMVDGQFYPIGEDITALLTRLTTDEQNIATLTQSTQTNTQGLQTLSQTLTTLQTQISTHNGSNVLLRFLDLIDVDPSYKTNTLLKIKDDLSGIENYLEDTTYDVADGSSLGEVITSVVVPVVGFEPSNAFTHNTTTYWKDSDLDWVGYNFIGAITPVVLGYSILVPNDATMSGLVSFVFEGSNSSTGTYTILDTRIGETFSAGQKKTYMLTSASNYSSYRVRVLDFVGDSYGIQQIQILGNGLDVLLEKADKNYVNTQISQLNTTLQDNIDTVNTTLQGNIDSVNTTLQGNIDTVNTTLQGNINILNQSKVNIIDYNTNNTTVSAALNTLTTEITNLQTSKADLTYVEQQIQQVTSSQLPQSYVDQQISNLSTTLNTEISSKANVSDLTSDISNLNLSITNLQTTLTSQINTIDTSHTSNENLIQTQVNNLSTNKANKSDLATEVTRATGVESGLQTRMTTLETKTANLGSNVYMVDLNNPLHPMPTSPSETDVVIDVTNPSSKLIKVYYNGTWI